MSIRHVTSQDATPRNYKHNDPKQLHATMAATRRCHRAGAAAEAEAEDVAGTAGGNGHGHAGGKGNGGKGNGKAEQLAMAILWLRRERR
eukprot:s60_g41.t1